MPTPLAVFIPAASGTVLRQELYDIGDAVGAVGDQIRLKKRYWGEPCTSEKSLSAVTVGYFRYFE
jgi:hypothetical protein